MFILAQCISGIALILNTSGRLFKKQSTNLLFNMVANVFVVASLILLGGYMGAVCTILSIMRTFVFYIYAKNGYHKKLSTLIIFTVCFIASGFIGFTNWLEYSLIVFKGLTYTYGAWQHNVQVFRYFSIASNIFTIGYNALYGGYINMINEFICIILTVILIYKAHNSENKLPDYTLKF